MSSVRLTGLQDRAGNQFMLCRNIWREQKTESTTHTGGSYSDAMVGGIYHMKGGSWVEWDIYLPLRNDNGDWGGAYIEPNVSINGSEWESLGSSGYSAVMSNDNQDIGFYTNRYYFNPGQAQDFTIQFKVRVAAYQDSATTSGSNEVNANNRGHNTNYLTNGDAHLQHYKKFIIKEWSGV